MNACLGAISSIRLTASICNFVRFDPPFEDLLEGGEIPALSITQGCIQHSSGVSINEEIDLI